MPRSEPEPSLLSSFWGPAHYSFLAYAAASDFDLGESPNSPNNNFEVQGFYCDSFPASPGDADPSLFVGGLLTNQRWGIGTLFPAAGLGDLTSYQSYCLATGLGISVCYSEQQTVAQALSDLADFTNSDIACTGTVTLIPRCDQPVTANGATFTPPESTFSFTDDDWLTNNAAATSSGSAAVDPLVLSRARPDTAINELTLEFLNKANQYSPEPVTARDPASIRRYGRRSDKSKQAHLFTNGVAARISAQLLLQNAATANEWMGTVGEQAIGTKVGHRGWISSAVQGIAPRFVKVKQIDEQADGSLAMVFGEILTGAGTAAPHTFATGRGEAPNYNVAPGPAQPPIFIDAPTELTGGALEVWLATAGGPNWGGCQVWVSSDDVTYARAGVITAGARMGTLTASLGASGDPDATGTLAVDISIGGGTLISGTQADADAFHTLCWVGGEMVSYETATLTGTGRYNLTYLRRGAYNTPIGAHAAGDGFVRLDRALLTYPYAKDKIGKAISVKLVSFNRYGGGIEDISEVEAYSYTIQGPPTPPTPTGFAAQQNGNVVAFGWNALPDYAVDIAVGPRGCTTGVTVDQAWAAMSMITEAARGSYDANASIQPGAWTFGIRARNTVSGQLSAGMATVDLVVANAQNLVESAPQAPGWPGALSGFVRHYTGVLIPDSALMANQVTAAQATMEFIPGAVAVSSYTTPAIDTAVVDQVRVWANIEASLGPGAQGNVNVAMGLDWSSDGIAWNGTFQPWTVGTVTARFFKARLTQTNEPGACVVTGFTVAADVSSKTDTGIGTPFASPAAVTAGGLAITFAQPFHLPPNVQTTALGAGMSSASAANVTTAGCTLHGWTGATDSGGLISWKATGP